MKQKVLGNLSRGLLFIISAPAGTGKTTLINKLLREFPCIKRAITSTTRPKRPNEVNGIDYHFLARDAFSQKINQGEMLEHVELYGDLYGSSSQGIETLRNEGKHVVLVIDTQGARTVRKKSDAITIMIRPPSLETLQERLAERDTETETKQHQRFALAQKELSCANEYDYLVLNDTLDVAYDILRSIFIAEEAKQKNQRKSS